MNIHRCRFIDYKPAAIQQISSSICEGMPIVAVARDNADIELWRTAIAADSAQQRRVNWTCQHRIHHPHPIESLVMTKTQMDAEGNFDSDGDDGDDVRMRASESASSQLPRLFVGTTQGTITEYSLIDDLQSMTEVDSFGGGAVWCMSVSPCRKYLAVGCEDGCVRLYDIDGPPGTIQYLRCFERQKGRIVCATWYQFGPSQNSLSDYFLFTGGSDGLIRKWDPSTGRSLLRIAVGSAVGNDELLVWNLVCVADDALASADSFGNIKIWDCRTCTLKQSFKAHSADALSISTNSTGDVLFSSGLDNKIVMHSYLKVEDSQESRWVLSQSRKFHTHDVRAIHWVQEMSANALVNKETAKRQRSDISHSVQKLRSKHAPCVDYLVSGGVDTLLTIMPNPSEQFPVKNYQPSRLMPFANNSIIRINEQRRLVMGYFDNRVVIYKLGNVSDDSFHNLVNSEGARFVVEIKLKSPAVVKTMEIHNDWLVILDSNQNTTIYHLKDTGRDESPLALVNMSSFIPEQIRSHCHQAQFTDSSKLVLARNHELVVVDLNTSIGAFKIEKTVSMREYQNRPFLLAPISMAASKCGRYVALCNAWNDLLVADLKKSKIIRIPTDPSTLMGPYTFVQLPSSPPILIYSVFGKGSSQTRLRAFDVTAKQFHPQLEKLLSSVAWLSQRKEKICGMVQHNADGQIPVLFIWSHRWIGRLELLPSSTEGSKKSEWSATTHFENVLGFGPLETNEFVVVEKPWIDVLETMQPPVSTTQYGV